MTTKVYLTVEDFGDGCFIQVFSTREKAEEYKENQVSECDAEPDTIGILEKKVDPSYD